jgi:outer membrane immunogenic protein
MKRFVVGFGILALATLPAFAADIPARMPAKVPVAVAPVMTWTGCYIGGHAGYAWSRSSHTFDNGAGVVETFDYNPNSFIGGGQVGCQYQFAPDWLIGLEGTWSGLRLNQTDVSVLSPPRQRSLNLDQIATGTVRIGYVWDRWMMYAKGGYATARIDTFAINPATGVSSDARNWEPGWTVGGGVEYMVVPQLVLGLEFDYYRFGYDRSGIVATDGTVGAYTNTRAEVYAVLGRASWLFNWGR